MVQNMDTLTLPLLFWNLQQETMPVLGKTSAMGFLKSGKVKKAPTAAKKVQKNHKVDQKNHEKLQKCKGSYTDLDN